MAEILHQLFIKAPPNKIYQALTEQKGLASWWTRYVRTEALVNSIAEFTFNKGQVHLRMKILRLILNKAVVWHCLGGHPEWEDTQIYFELEPSGTGTIVHFAHRGWKRSTGILPQCSFDWARYLMSLRAYIEKGKGYPARD
ncbi:MAG: SRPBCC domain-containing protein [Coxiellaceae bacterium]|nr:MAG: SRPBCC domain-containing protein [Coxiellaceae bacterium]